MTNAALVTLLLAAGALAPGAVLGQEPVQLALVGRPQPHFVAAWAPTKEREAERSAALARRVSLELTDVSLDAALKALTNRAGLRITYSAAVLPAGKRVTISARDVAVVTALTEMLFRSGLDVVVDRDGALALVVCRHREVEVADSGAIVGRVTDKATGLAIVGATVLVEGTQRSATTGTDGRYRIGGLEVGTYAVRARSIGYAPLQVSTLVSATGETDVPFALEKSVQQLDQVVVTGSVVPTEVKALPTPISVISSADIERHNLQRIDQIFRGQVPGVLAWDQGSADYFSTIAVRGTTTLDIDPTIKTYIDGVEVSNPQFIASIDPRSVERVEITRGPQASTVYGSDASGGVLQIFTKKGAISTHPQVAGQVTFGALESRYDQGLPVRQDYALSLSGGDEDQTFNLGGSFEHTGEWTPDYVSRSPSLFAGASLTRDRLTTEVSARYVSRTWQSPFNPELRHLVFFSQPPHEANELQQQTYGVNLSYQASRHWSHQLIVGYDRTENGFRNTAPKRTTPADTFLTVANSSSDKASIRYNTSYRGPLYRRVDLTGTLGVEHYQATASSDVAIDATRPTGAIDGLHFVNDDQFTNTGYFGQVQLGFNDMLFLTAGLRAEQNDNFGDRFGTAWSPRIGASFIESLPGVALKLRASYGSSIRPPEPGQRQAIVQVTADQLANPTLAPERQAGWDAGIEAYFGSRASLGISYYRQVAKSLIDIVILTAGDRPQYQFQNTGRIRNTGWEFEGRLALGDVQFAATYSRPQSTVEALGPTYEGDLLPGDNLLNIPSSSAGASLTYSPTSATTIAASLTHIGSWTGTDWVGLFGFFYGTDPYRGSGRDYWMRYPSITKVDVSLSQALGFHVTGFLKVDNIGNNTRYELTNDRVPLGRITTAGVRLRL